MAMDSTRSVLQYAVETLKIEHVMVVGQRRHP